jgi:hypothetical protein
MGWSYPVIPGRCKASNYDVQLHIGESRDSPMRNCASEVWSFGPSRNDDTGQRGSHAATTSSLITTNFFNSIRPKLVVSATSAASRPVPIRMRPIRG